MPPSKRVGRVVDSVWVIPSEETRWVLLFLRRVEGKGGGEGRRLAG